MAVVLDIDLDYFMTCRAETDFSVKSRLPEYDFGESVWKRNDVINFIENHLGLSKDHKIPGRFIIGHDESLYFWEELMKEFKLDAPFEVVHIDSHGDLGVGQTSHVFLQGAFLTLPVEMRRKVRETSDGESITIGDYLLWAVGYKMVSQIIYCANSFLDPHDDRMDVNWTILKNFENEYCNGYDIVHAVIQLKYNPKYVLPFSGDPDENDIYLDGCTVLDPEVPLTVIPTIEDVKFDGNFDYITVAQSPNYTPASADYILDIFRDYVEEI